MHTLKKLPGKTKKIWAVGERAHALWRTPALRRLSCSIVPTSVHAITPLIGQILIEIEAAREKGDVVEVYLFHNHPKTGAVYEPVCKRLLPLDHDWQSKLAAVPWPTKKLAGSHRRPHAGASRLSFEDICSFCSFRLARNRSTAKTPAVWRPCNAPKRTSNKSSKI